ncbi:hypothetical protein [Bacillus mesophilum]|uniref:Uncharacterized protein n=1 Tax=Bacillus mesophilum TaxID=1071718 RepID=A0A7V7RI09_9BACI|nr:hypothetical protein [Bacillus mesophilum]KAB2329467.1 hypothetical protein F7732_21315 [Bacillus mesophilum]
MKKRFLLIFSVLLLFFATPLQSLAALSNQSVPNGIKDSHTFQLEGVTYTLTLETDEDVQTAYIESEKDGLQTVSYDRVKDELRFNGELASDEYLAEIRDASEDLSEGLQKGEEKLSGDLQISDAGFSTMSDYNWRLVHTFNNSFNVTLFTVYAVTAIILLLPTGTGAVMGIILTAKIIASLASAIVSASDTSGSTIWYTFKIYYSPKDGYYNNMFTLTTYKNSARTQYIKLVNHITRAGKKYD